MTAPLWLIHKKRRSFSSCRRNFSQRAFPTQSHGATLGGERDHAQEDCAYLSTQRWNAVSHHRPRSQGKRNRGCRRWYMTVAHRSLTKLLVSYVILCLLCIEVSARPLPNVEKFLWIDKRSRSSLDPLAQRGELLVDRGEPSPARMPFAPRDDAAETITVPVLTTTTASARSQPVTTTTITQTSSLAVDTSAASSSPLPRPFDTNLGDNFTASCQPFFDSFLDNPDFQRCVPFSLLLQVCSKRPPLENWRGC